MSDRTIGDLAKAIGKIDFAMLTTRTEGGQLATHGGEACDHGQHDQSGMFDELIRLVDTMPLRTATAAIIIDPKGDLTNLCLTFPNLAPTYFQPWVNESGTT